MEVIERMSMNAGPCPLQCSSGAGTTPCIAPTNRSGRGPPMRKLRSPISESSRTNVAVRPSLQCACRGQPHCKRGVVRNHGVHAQQKVGRCNRQLLQKHSQLGSHRRRPTLGKHTMLCKVRGIAVHKPQVCSTPANCPVPTLTMPSTRRNMAAGTTCTCAGGGEGRQCGHMERCAGRPSPQSASNPLSQHRDAQQTTK